MKNCCYLSILTSKADPHLCGRPFSFVCFQLQLNEEKASFPLARVSTCDPVKKEMTVLKVLPGTNSHQVLRCVK